MKIARSEAGRLGVELANIAGVALEPSARACGAAKRIELAELVEKPFAPRLVPGSRGSGGPEFLAWSAWASGASNGGAELPGVASRNRSEV